MQTERETVSRERWSMEGGTGGGRGETDTGWGEVDADQYGVRDASH